MNTEVIEQIEETLSRGSEYAGTQEVVYATASEILSDCGSELISPDEIGLTDGDNDIITLQDFVDEFWDRSINLFMNVLKSYMDEEEKDVGKEKYKEALEMIGDCELDLELDGNLKLIKDFYHDEYKTLENLIKEYFKLVKIHNKLLKLWGMEYPKAYEFKELKPNMWVYDIETNFIYKIFNTHKEDGTIEVVVHDRDASHLRVVHLCVFKKNRFYPVIKAIDMEIY